MRYRIAAAAAVLLGAALAVGPTAASPAALISAMVTVEPGTVIRAYPATHVAPSLRRLVSDAIGFSYHSTGVHGERTEVSGAYYLPLGPVPVGGWPVVAFAHGTSGVLEHCAPSREPGMFGSIGTVKALLQRRWAVVATDYQGLGSPGPFPYLNARVEGVNVLDSIRALHRLSAAVSDRTVLFGVSLGGQAVEYAAENADRYAPELSLLGNVMVSPALNYRPLVAAIDRGKLTISQYVAAPLRVHAVQVSQDPKLATGDVLHGIVAKDASTLLQCVGQAERAKWRIGKAAHPRDVSFATPAARTAFARFLDENALPQRRHSLPTFISRGIADTLVSTAWSDTAVRDMCRLGIPVHQKLRPGGHSVSSIDLPAALGWINAILHNSPPAPATCSG